MLFLAIIIVAENKEYKPMNGSGSLFPPLEKKTLRLKGFLGEGQVTSPGRIPAEGAFAFVRGTVGPLNPNEFCVLICTK